MHRHAFALVGAAGLGAAILTTTVLAAAGPADAADVRPAHIRIDGDATAGTTSTITFRVPTESETASTTTLTVHVPSAALITSVTPQFKPGWDVQVVTSELDPPIASGSVEIRSDITEIRWTASGGGIPHGQFDTFTVRIGIPAAGTLTLPATQGYSDGTTVEWSDPAPADGSEAAHPAPSIEVAPAATGSPSPAPGAAPDGVNDGSDPALAISVAALIVGALGLAAAVIAIATRRRAAG